MELIGLILCIAPGQIIHSCLWTRLERWEFTKEKPIGNRSALRGISGLVLYAMSGALTIPHVMPWFTAGDSSDTPCYGIRGAEEC